jgi:hypothetical protein
MQEKIVTHTEILIRIIKLYAPARAKGGNAFDNGIKKVSTRNVSIYWRKACAYYRGINTAIPRPENVVRDCRIFAGSEGV